MNEYKYFKGIPTLTKRTEEQINPQQKSIHTKVWDITDGEFKLTKDTTAPYEE
ncbi:hypothetical protein [Bacillus sp. FJAT-27264]|uniref:hypothetical protein n=1 Tax=Paenibacillus sp. (strain DSM 101736 / FJAT-27264) TaxID=1850362 RepID=UPI001585D73D|nr:hypothetical protein [Bacillus sp. FJAT-27264]